MRGVGGGLTFIQYSVFIRTDVKRHVSDTCGRAGAGEPRGSEDKKGNWTTNADWKD